MATSSAKILIDGSELDPYNVILEQRFDSHHHFSIAISSEKVEGDYSSSIDNSLAYIGSQAEIQIERGGEPGLNFKGIITSVHIDRTYTADSLIVFEGVSPTYLSEDGKGTRSFAEMDLGAIADEVLGAYPGNLFNPQVSPQYGGTIPYVVQYRETNFEFLQRMAALYGEWFFYDGQSVVFGQLPSPDTIDLTLGDDLSSFNLGVNIKPTTFKYQSYNYAENRTVETSTKGFQPGWLDNYAKKGLEVADSLFPSEPLDKVYHEAQDDAVLKHLAEANKSSMLSDSSFFRGESQHPGLTVGSRIGAHAINKIGKSNTKSFIGRYRVIAVTHRLDPNKDYHNSFEAIPLSVTAPPVNHHVSRPMAEDQVAEVTDNNDPDQLGRVRVKHKWQSDGETPWIRIMTNHAFGDRGMYFVPEIGDEVLVGFEQANPDRPYMKGAHYHGSAKPEWADPDNNLKAIKTRSGHTILLDDKDGEESITILDKSGNTFFMDTKEKSITISAPETMTLNCKNMNINVEEDMTVKVGGNKSTKVSGNTQTDVGGKDSLSVGSKQSFTIGDNQSTRIGGGYEITVSNAYDLTAKSASESVSKNMNVSVGSGYSLDSRKSKFSSEQNVEIVAQDIAVNAKSRLETKGGKQADHEGGKMTVNAKGKMMLKGGATTYLQGSKVKIQG